MKSYTRKRKVDKPAMVVKEKASLSEKDETVEVKRGRKRALLRNATTKDVSKVVSMEKEKSANDGTLHL